MAIHCKTCGEKLKMGTEYGGIRDARVGYTPSRVCWVGCPNEARDPEPHPIGYRYEDGRIEAVDDDEEEEVQPE